MHRRAKIVSLAVSALLISACTSPRYRAPVEDRSRSTPTPTAPAAPPTVEAAGAQAKPAGIATDKPVFVTVKPGDTLIRIATDAGQSWRDVARWNNISNPGLIEVGQLLRVQPPDSAASPSPEEGSVAARPVSAGRVESRPLEPRPQDAARDTRPTDARPADSKPAETKPAESPNDPKPSSTVTVSPPLTAPVPTPAPATVVTAPAPSSPAPTPPSNGNAPAAGDDAVQWIWPAAGAIGTTFDGAKAKGVTILGKAGDPVVAAGDGRVIYAGSSLRGYGNIVIVKHNNTYITAYAHNRTLLVKEEQTVRRGQRIAEMGSTDADRVQLHFELRKNGVAIDPLKHLPAR